MGDKLLMNVDSIYLPYKNGEELPENPLNISEEDLKIRKVVYLDLINGKPKPDKNRDLSNWVCPKLHVDEKFSSYEKKKLVTEHKLESEPPKWTKNFNGPMMVQIKLVKIKFDWRGLESIVERFATKTLYHHLFTDNARAMLIWTDEWIDKSYDDILKLELQAYDQTNAKGFERDDDKPDEEPPSERPEGVPEKPKVSDDDDDD
ncbi:hypothetical protein M9Y10_043035 [Tritrichomonas musculus]|uniref:Phosphatidylinositol transfer protein N-terminal domain-containing protein n=1 Tax=Tritrichomonas musculus TaxID=1915356 RepID=A0ABR2JZ79_9EUKA